MSSAELTAKKSLVTGGGGFVGRKLVDALRSRGDEVTVLERAGGPHRDDIRWIEGDICDAAAVSAAIAGHDAVFHNASVVHTRQHHEDVVWSVNLEGSRNVLTACQEQGVGKLIYVSSASAVYEGRDIENGDEELPYSSVSQAPYADSKIAAEKMILAASGEHGVATCAIRPHVIFGPGDNRFLPAILDRAKAGKLKFGVGRGDKLSDFTYVSNLTDALLAASDRLEVGGPVSGQAFFVTNGEPMAFFDFVGRVLQQLELPEIKGSVPYAIAYPVAAIAEAVDRLKGGKLDAENGLSRFAVRYMCTHHYFNIDKARRLLDYEPKVDLEEGIRITCDHLRSTGALA